MIVGLAIGLVLGVLLTCVVALLMARRAGSDGSGEDPGDPGL